MDLATSEVASDPKPYVCPNPQCGKRYTARQNLFRHCRTSKDDACVYRNSRQKSASRDAAESPLPARPPDMVGTSSSVSTPSNTSNCQKMSACVDNTVRELECVLCNRVFFSVKQFSKHIEVCSMGDSKRRKNLRCNIEQCNAEFYRYSELLMHLKVKHEYDSQKLEYRFQNRAQFLTWLSEHQLGTYVCSIKRGQKRKKDGTLYYYYACQYDAARFYRPCTKRKRGPIPSGFCPARLSVIEDRNGTLTVTHHSIHSHPVTFKNVKFQRMPREILAHVKRQLSLGVDADYIYKSVRNMGRARVEKEGGERMNILTAYKKRHVSMIKYRQNKLTYAHPNDAISVFVQATETYKNDIFVYKPQECATVIGHGNEANVDCLERSKTLFAFGYMNDNMYDQIQRLGNRPICIDFTHGTNQYDFYLLVFNIPDEYGKGYLAGFMLCNYTDQKTLIALLTCLKNRRPNLTINVFITDDDRALYRSILTVFAQPFREIVHLLCLWHIDQNFRKNLRRIVKRGAQRQLLYSILHKLTHTRSLQQFEQLEVQLKEYCTRENFSNVGGRRFLRYYNKHYAPKHGKWAMCRRRFFHFGFETNMLVESFFNFLKSNVFRRRMPGRADVLFHHLIEINREQTENLKYKIATEEPTIQVWASDVVRHERGIQIPLSNIIQSNDSSWKVLSSRQVGVYYEVSRINERCVIPNRCGGVCANDSCVDLCVCLYQCSCPDIAALCKHVHKVHSIFRIATNSRNKISSAVDASFSGYCIPNAKRDIPKEYRKSTLNLLVTEYEKLGKFLSRVKNHTSVDENARLSNILIAVRQCNTLFEGYFGGEAIPDAIEVSLPLSKKKKPNEKIPKQLRLFRTSKLRKKKEKEFGEDGVSSSTALESYDESIRELRRVNLACTVGTTVPYLQCGDKVRRLVIVEGVKCNVKNSSAFDALFHVIYAAFRDSCLYKKYIIEWGGNVPLLDLVLRTAMADTLLPETYKSRASMLKDIVPYQVMDNDTLVVDTTAVAMSAIISSLLKLAPSYEEICFSCSCDDDPRCSRVSVTKRINEIGDLCDVYIFPSPDDFVCPKCSHLVSPEDMVVQLSPHVLIEIKNRGSIALKNIATTVHMNEGVYLLRGVVGTHDTQPSHRVAYCRRPLHWQLFDGCSANRPAVVEDSVVVECEVLLYTIKDENVKSSMTHPPKLTSTTTGNVTNESTAVISPVSSEEPRSVRKRKKNSTKTTNKHNRIDHSSDALPQLSLTNELSGVPGKRQKWCPEQNERPNNSQKSNVAHRRVIKGLKKARATPTTKVSILLPTPCTILSKVEENKCDKMGNVRKMTPLTPALTDDTRKLLNRFSEYKLGNSNGWLSLLDAKSLDPYLSDIDFKVIRQIQPTFTRGWLWNSVIDAFYANLLSVHRPSINCHAVSSNVISLFSTERDAREAIITEDSCIAQRDIIFCPYYSSDHWTLVVLQLPQRQAIILNSLHDANIITDTNRHGKFIKKWAEILNIPAFKILYPPCVRQDDSMSCGVFVCSYGERLLEGTSLCDPLNADAYRLKIYRTITRNTIFDIEGLNPPEPIVGSKDIQPPTVIGSSSYDGVVVMSPIRDLPNERVSFSPTVTASTGDLLPLLRNGNQFPNGVRISNTRLLHVWNTSFFDSLFQVMLAAAVDSAAYRKCLQKIDSESTLRNAVHYFSTTMRVNQSFYSMRAKLLMSIDCTENDKIQDVDAKKYNIWSLVHHLIYEPSATECITKGTCGCLDTTDPEMEPQTQERHTSSFSIRVRESDIVSANLKSLMEETIYPENGVICHVCEEKIGGIEISFGPQVIIHLVLRSNEEGERSHIVKASLSYIPKSLFLYTDTFVLRGVISLEGSTLEPNGHYIAYCWREKMERWESYDSSSIKKKVLASDSEVVYWDLLFYTKRAENVEYSPQ